MSGSWASYFDEAAADYDESTRHDWTPNEHARQVLAEQALAPGTVLDLGAGTGQTGEVLAGLYPDAELTLVDASEGMAAVARGRLPSARVVVEDADTFLVEAGPSYDLVTAIGFLEMLPDLARTVAAAAARLNPGGHLLITHEPLLPGEGVQSDPLTLIGGAHGRAVHRLLRAAVEQVGVDAGLERVLSREFAAFARSDTRDSVVYELVLWVG